MTGRLDDGSKLLQTLDEDDGGSGVRASPRTRAHSGQNAAGHLGTVLSFSADPLGVRRCSSEPADPVPRAYKNKRNSLETSRTSRGNLVGYIIPPPAILHNPDVVHALCWPSAHYWFS